MPHIHTLPGQHDTTSSALIVRLDGPEPRVLYHMHKKIGLLLHPGGHVELDENPWQSILREIVEETGFDLGQLTLLQPRQRLRALTGAYLQPVAVCQNTHRFSGDIDHYHSDTCYGFVAGGAPVGLPADGESLDLRWLTATDLRAIPSNEISRNSREMALFMLETCLPEWEEVSLSEYTSH